MDSENSPESINRLVLQFIRQHFTRIHGLMEEIGVFRGQPPLLHQLWDQEGSTQTELAERLHLTPATVTKMLQRMEQSGLVERKPDPNDQRITRVYLTSAAYKLKDAIETREAQVGREMLEGFTPDEQEQLTRFLERMRDNLLRINQESL